MRYDVEDARSAPPVVLTQAMRALRVKWFMGSRVPAAHAQAAFLQIAERGEALLLALRIGAKSLASADRDQATQALHVLAPVAAYVGHKKLSQEIEDAALRILEPAFVARLSAFADSSRPARDEAVRALAAELTDELDYYGIEASVTGRAKTLYSIFRKLQRRSEDATLHDLYGLRVFVPDVDACYRALGVIHLSYSPVPERFRDYIARPKPSGYQSLHTVVRVARHPHLVELQIRTPAMHDAAEHGSQSHFNYKFGSALPGQLERAGWVYPLTPRGEVRRLPAGANVLDFAYAVHTDIGRSFRGAQLDGRQVQATTPVLTGQVVEIDHAGAVSATEGQLQRVRTARARNRIRTQLLRAY